LGYTDRAVNLGNFYPVAAVYEAGGFVSPPYYPVGDPFYSAAANYTVTLTHPAAYVVAASGRATESTRAADAVTTRYEGKAMRDFALVLSKQFNVVAGTYKNTDVRYYYYRDPDPAGSLKAATDSLSVFSERFGAYPYPTYAAVQTAFNQGGMEYPGLVYVSDRYSGNECREIIIHETAHQWWYGVVGNDETAHAWLDEGLAEYSTTLFYEWSPSYRVTKQERMQTYIQAYYLFFDVYKIVTGTPNMAMDRPLQTFASPHEYYYLTYVRGVLFFDALRGTVGDKRFFEALRAYYAANAYKNAAPSDLVAAFERACGQSLSGVFEAWMSGKVA
ncbi:MAG: M1 family metallopeptidase, partial [Clostridiales bacterium]|nr:M1 family metallopeptidase [Clostridiales bacterium]